MIIKNIPIFLSSDNNYAPFVATTIASICDNTKSFIDFYILDGGISKENQAKICEIKKQFNNFSIEFIEIDMENDLKSIKYKNACPHITLSTYSRFLIPYLKPELEKIIYLDVDIVVLDDIKKLFSIDLENYSLGAIPENKTNLKNSTQRNQKLNLSERHDYFNAGVLLIDNSKWIKENISEQLFETEAKRRDELLWADQDVLNIIFDNNYKRIDYLFNHMTDSRKPNNIIIRHFNTEIKPWNISPELDTSIIFNINDFWHYAKKTPFCNELKKNIKYQTKMQLKVIELLKKKKNG